MEFETKHIGRTALRPATILELTINGDDYSITEDILNFKDNKVDENFITALMELANELQGHNDFVDGK